MRMFLWLLPSFVLFIMLWRAQRALAQQRAAQAACEQRARSAEQAGQDGLRLLRAAGSELREQALKLLGKSGADLATDPTEAAAIAAHLLAIADDLQDHAPPSPQSRVLTRELLPLQPLLTQCIDAVATNLRPSQRLWKLDAGLADLQLYVDQRALAQVLLRVLSNAARATKHLDWIEINAEHCDDQLILSVQDEGTGLLVPNSDKPRDGRGFGLGLSVARSLVKAHGGNLSVESVLGIGARVEIALPSCKAP